MEAVRGSKPCREKGIGALGPECRSGGGRSIAGSAMFRLCRACCKAAAPLYSAMGSPLMLIATIPTWLYEFSLFMWHSCRTKRSKRAFVLMCTLFSSLAWGLLRSLESNERCPSFFMLQFSGSGARPSCGIPVKISTLEGILCS